MWNSVQRRARRKRIQRWIATAMTATLATALFVSGQRRASPEMCTRETEAFTSWLRELGAQTESEYIVSDETELPSLPSSRLWVTRGIQLELSNNFIRIDGETISDAPFSMAGFAALRETLAEKRRNIQQSAALFGSESLPGAHLIADRRLPWWLVADVFQELRDTNIRHVALIFESPALLPRTEIGWLDARIADLFSDPDSWLLDTPIPFWGSPDFDWTARIWMAESWSHCSTTRVLALATMRIPTCVGSRPQRINDFVEYGLDSLKDCQCDVDLNMLRATTWARYKPSDDVKRYAYAGAQIQLIAPPAAGVTAAFSPGDTWELVAQRLYTKVDPMDVTPVLVVP